MKIYEEKLKEMFARRTISHILEDIPDYYLQASSVDWRLVNMVPLKGKKLLNVGCGSHLVSDLYFAMKGADVVSIDMSRSAIETAKKKLAKLDNKRDFNLQVMVADGRYLSFPKNTFDIVVSFSAVEHMERYDDRLEAIEEMARVVKPGGVVTITGPNYLNLPVTFFSGRMFKRRGGYEHRYMPWELKNMLKRCGLKIVEFDAESVYVIDKRLIETRFPSLANVPLPFFKPLVLFMWVFNKIRLLKIFGMRIGYRAEKT